MKSFLSAIWLTTVLIVCCLFFSLTSCISHVLMRLFLNKEQLNDLGHNIAIMWARSIMTLVPGWRASVSGKENLPKDAPYVLVSNHESMTDIFVILLIGSQFRFLSKESIFKIPIFGTAMKVAGYIGVHRGNPRSHIAALNESKKTVEGGRPMLFFAEGTRSQSGELLPFKIGAFKLAADTKATVVPICLKGTRNLLLKGSLIPGRADVSVSILKPIPRQNEETLEDWASRTRASILDARDR